MKNFGGRMKEKTTQDLRLLKSRLEKQKLLAVGGSKTKPILEMSSALAFCVDIS